MGGRFEKSSFHLANSLANTCQINQLYSGGGIIISAESTCSSYWSIDVDILRDELHVKVAVFAEKPTRYALAKSIASWHRTHKLRSDASRLYGDEQICTPL